MNYSATPTLLHSRSFLGALRVVIGLVLLAGLVPWTEARRLRRRRNNTGDVFLKAEYPFYHTSNDITSELQRLASTCKGAELSIDRLEDSDVGLDVVSVRSSAGAGPGKNRTNRVLLLSGEHARELIGAESTLRFLRVLCGDASVNSSLSVSEVLSSSEFKVVVNANPMSRTRVEQGEYCIRENENEVDLNRNWDEEWNASMTIETDRGPHPFSEPETRMLRKLGEAFQPTAFLSVHSGTLGMYMPWAWSPDLVATRNRESMTRVLQAVDGSHCRCPFGSAGKEVGYPCPGTSVDWMFDKLRTPYAYAFEIWGRPSSMESMRQRWQEKMLSGGAALLQSGEHLGHLHFRDVFEAYPSEFVDRNRNVGRKSKHLPPTALTHGMSRDDCFEMFNPSTNDLYEHTVQNWAAAYLEFSAAVAEELRQNRAVL